MQEAAPAERLEMEWKALRFFCVVSSVVNSVVNPMNSQRADLLRRLSPASFLDSFHRIVFEEIHALGNVSPASLRELLPSRLTNRGFPDFDDKALFRPVDSSGDEMKSLFQSALQLADDAHDRSGSES